MTPLDTHSAGGVVLNKGDVLLVSQQGQTWSLPKGHVEGDDNRYDTAVREIYEETGILHLDYIQDLGSYQRYKIAKDGKSDDTSERKHMHFFLFKTQQRFVQSHDSDNPDVCWVPVKDVENKLTHPKDKAFFNASLPYILPHLHEAIVIETTCPTQKQALAISDYLIKEKLAACCHIQAIASVYSWEHNTEHEQEYKCSIKTVKKYLKQVTSAVSRLSPYDCPQIVVLPVCALSQEYADWFKTIVA